MNQPEPSTNNDIGTLAADASALLSATAEVTGAKITEARKRLAVALESGKKMFSQVKDKAVEGAKATDATVREHPYAAIGIALGVGGIVGFLLASRLTRGRGRD